MTAHRVKCCYRCRLRYINAAPADVCLTCDGELNEPLVPSAPPPRPPLADPDMAQLAILEGLHRD